jgi:hypothetical protein
MKSLSRMSKITVIVFVSLLCGVASWAQYLCYTVSFDDNCTGPGPCDYTANSPTCACSCHMVHCVPSCDTYCEGNQEFGRDGCTQLRTIQSRCQFRYYDESNCPSGGCGALITGGNYSLPLFYNQAILSPNSCPQGS